MHQFNDNDDNIIMIPRGGGWRPAAASLLSIVLGRSVIWIDLDRFGLWPARFTLHFSSLCASSIILFST